MCHLLVPIADFPKNCIYISNQTDRHEKKLFDNIANSIVFKFLAQVFFLEDGNFIFLLHVSCNVAQKKSLVHIKITIKVKTLLVRNSSALAPPS